MNKNHDENLTGLLKRARKVNLSVNKKKWKEKVTEVSSGGSKKKSRAFVIHIKMTVPGELQGFYTQATNN